MIRSYMSPIQADMIYWTRCAAVDFIYVIGKDIFGQKGDNRLASCALEHVINKVADNRDCGATSIQYCMKM